MYRLRDLVSCVLYTKAVARYALTKRTTAAAYLALVRLSWFT